MLTVLAKQFSMETIDQEDMKEARALALHLLKAFWYVKKNFLQCFKRLSEVFKIACSQQLSNYFLGSVYSANDHTNAFRYLSGRLSGLKRSSTLLFVYRHFEPLCGPKIIKKKLKP